MALNARDMLLIVRAQNQASGALRRVARDVGTLGNVKGLRQRAAQLRINEQQLRTQRQQALANEQSYRTGLKQVQLDKRRATLAIETQRAELRAAEVEKARLVTSASYLRNQAQISALTRRQSALSKAGLGGSIIAKENTDRLAAARIQAQALSEQEALLTRKANIATEAIDRQSIALRELAAKEAEAGRMANYWAARQKVATDRLALNAVKIRETNAAINAARWDKIGAAGRIMQHTSRVFQYGALIVGGSLAVMAHSAAMFETQSTLAATQITNKWHQSAQGVLAASRIIQKGVLNMAANRQTISSMEDNQAAVYDIYSSMTLKGNQRQQISQGIQLLKLFNQAAIAGSAPLKDVTEAGITILNDFGKAGQQVQQLPKFLQRMFAAVRFGRMTVGQFVGSLNQVAPAFSAAFGRTPHSFDQLSEAMAGLTRHMPSTRMAATALARLTEMLSRKDFVAGMAMLHMPITTGTGANKHLIDLEKITEMIAKRRPDLAKGGLALQNFFKETTALGSGKAGTTGTIQGRRAFQFLVQNAKAYHAISRQVVNDNNEFTKSFKAMANTSGVKWQLFVQQMHAFAIEIGQAVIPVISQLAKPLMQAVDWFNKLDQSTKNSIGKWLSYTAIISGLASVVLFLGGTFLRLFAFMGRGIGLFGSILSTVILLTAAVSALSGNWNGLNGMIDTFVHYGTGSIAGWVTMLGLAAVAALKLRGALMAVAGAEGVAGAGGMLGIFGRGRGAATGVRDLYQVRRLEGAGRVMSGMAASAAMIPASLGIAAAAMAVVAGGALLWKSHMAGVRKEAEAAARAMANVQRLGNIPTAQAAQLGTLGGAAAGAQQAGINLRAADKAIRDARKKGTSGDALKQLYLDRYNAAVAAQIANAKADKIFDSLSRSLQGQGNLLANLGKQSQLLAKLRAHRASMATSGQDKVIYGDGLTGEKDAQALDRAITRTAQRMDVLRTKSIAGANALAANFSTAITNLAKLNNIRVSPTAITDMFNFALKKGRMITIPEIRAFVNAEVSPKALAKVRGDIRAAINAGQGARNIAAGRASVVTIKPKIAKSWMDSLAKSPVNIRSLVIPPRNVQAVHNNVAKVFRKNIIQRITISPGPGAAHARGVAIGAALAQGAASGIDANAQAVINAAVSMVDQAATAARAHAKIKSPSRLFADTVGKPIGQGIAMGILEARGDIQKAAALTIDIFQGALLSNFTPGKKATKLQIERAVHSLTTAQASLAKKHGDTVSNRQRVQIAKDNLAALRGKGGKSITPAMLTKDLQGQLKTYQQFNNGLDKLRKRKVPNALLEQLSALGVSGSSNIAKLASMSDKELKKYVSIWKKANKEVTKSAQYSKADVTAALKSLTKDAASSLLDTYNGFKDANTQNFGNLFEGPGNLSDKFGDSFKNAVDTYNSDLADYQSQIADLNNQLADVNKQAFDDMSTSFGQLFSGDFLQSADVQTRLDWGQKLGFDDLEKDLQSQLDKFNRWRSDLTNVAAKVPPELAKQLEALGPDAVDKLDILNGATDDQLKQYVATWKQAQAVIGTAANGAVQNNSVYSDQVNAILTQIDDITKKMGALSKPQGLTGQDVLNDIQGQIDAFGEYQGTLTELANRGLPKELVQQLQQMGPSAEPYLKALNSLTDQQLLGPGGFVDKWTTAGNMITAATNTMMQTQLEIWYQYGANSAAQIIAGVSSQQQPLIDYFTNLFKNLLAGNTTTFTPPTGGGTGGGTGTRGGGSHAQFADQYLPSGTSGGTVITNNNNIEVNAVQDESLQTTMERATFRLGQRRPE